MNTGRFLALALFVQVFQAASAASFSIQDVFTSKETGSGEAAYTPKVGEAYRIAVRYTQTGAASQPYRIDFSVAGRVGSVIVDDLSPGQKTQATTLWAPLDDEVPFSVTIDPGSPSETKSSAHFRPVHPDAIVEFYDTVTITGAQVETYSIFGLYPYEFKFMSGQPATDGWQKYISGKCTVQAGHTWIKDVSKQLTEGPFQYPICFYDGKNLTAPQLTFHQSFTLKLSSERVNPDKLRLITWADMDALQAISVFKHFTEPEQVIESNHAAIAAFVSATLGKGFREKYTPYDAARKLFMAVLKRCKYSTVNGGNTAVETYYLKQGDCGSFSMLITAVFRNIGIPARCSCGAWVGHNLAHCWTDMWFPGAGWIVCDGSSGDYFSENGAFAFQFGFIPDLNSRFAQMRGNTFLYKGCYANFLQGPMWPVTIPQMEVKKLLDDTLTQLVTTPSSFSLKIAKTLQAGLPKWNAALLQKPTKPLPHPNSN